MNNVINYSIELNTECEISGKYINIKECDRINRLSISVFNGITPVSFNPESTVQLCFAFPDGEKSDIPARIDSNGMIIVEIPHDMSSLEGTMDCEIKVYSSDVYGEYSVFTSPKFTICISGTIYDADTMDGIVDDEEIFESIQEAEAERQNNEEERISSYLYRTFINEEYQKIINNMEPTPIEEVDRILEA